MVKISQIIREHKEARRLSYLQPEVVDDEKTAPDFIPQFCSYEFFVPRKQSAIEKLYKLAKGLIEKHRPLYIDITWRGKFEALFLHIEVYEKLKMLGVEIMLHLAVSQMTKPEVLQVLNTCREYGIQNILALRGDPPSRDNKSFVPFENGFSCALELVQFIRANHGDYFCIGVAGYPEGHLTSSYDMATELDYTLAKVEAGADMVITQGCYRAETIHEYVMSLQARGVQVPIIPGILMFKSRHSLKRMAQLCEIDLPRSWTAPIEEMHEGGAPPEVLLQKGYELTYNLVEQLRQKGYTELHFYTMNDDKCIDFIMDRFRAMKDTKSMIEESRDDLMDLLATQRPELLKDLLMKGLSNFKSETISDLFDIIGEQTGTLRKVRSAGAISVGTPSKSWPRSPSKTKADDRVS